MKRPGLILVSLILISIASSCGNPPKVVQGTVISYAEETKTLVVIDSLPPNVQFTFSLEKAEYGATPQVNDVVRIAYRESGGKLMAIRVMNLDRQRQD